LQWCKKLAVVQLELLNSSGAIALSICSYNYVKSEFGFW